MDKCGVGIILGMGRHETERDSLTRGQPEFGVRKIYGVQQGVRKYRGKSRKALKRVGESGIEDFGLDGDSLESLQNDSRFESMFDMDEEDFERVGLNVEHFDCLSLAVINGELPEEYVNWSEVRSSLEEMLVKINGDAD